ncbi:MAG TPA: hypothetical protein VF352_04265, partial [Anaerolineales bacterium]
MVEKKGDKNLDLKSSGGETVRVRPPLAPYTDNLGIFRQITLYIGGIWQEKFLESPLGVKYFNDTH